ncbi:ketoacyl-ACP synthase III family protein [Kibdelosporangium persicum]|uniref:3-oxoacyl-[acyl-carrier-protein] synthase III n=1 Tax=Kibdelosporangium persicum TaxID=2698649 RepID=A0ABX2FG80_9PSEU|nr:ketoacyl-ACP synthase III family protein [Kibdelosporangium persicum]NRN70399.1 3-oxoacyl-[acyl-carrier-protein] synthase III [Kibdelosporangium persicum]
MTTVALKAVAFSWPDRAVAVAGLPGRAVLGATERETLAGLGIERIRADDAVSGFELAAGAARQALSRAGVAPADVGALVVIEPRSPETLMSSEATRLQAALGAGRAVVFSVGGLGCVSVTPALLAARGLVAADADMDNVLVVHGSKPVTPLRYRHPVTVNGDGGMAAVISRQGRVRIVDILQETNGDYWDLFAVDYRDRPSARWRERCRDLHDYSFALAVESGNRLRALYTKLLERNDLRAEDIDGHIGHNLSVGSLRFVEDALGVRIAGTCFDNLRQYGHLGPNDVLLNLQVAMENGELCDGQRVLLVNSSPVAAWSMVLVEIGG